MIHLVYQDQVGCNIVAFGCRRETRNVRQVYPQVFVRCIGKYLWVSGCPPKSAGCDTPSSRICPQNTLGLDGGFGLRRLCTRLVRQDFGVKVCPIYPFSITSSAVRGPDIGEGGDWNGISGRCRCRLALSVF